MANKKQEKKVSIQHNLPVKVSQYLDVGKSGRGVCAGDSCNEFWAKRVCGPASLAMVTAYYFSKNEPSVVGAISKIYPRRLRKSGLSDGVRHSSESSDRQKSSEKNSENNSLKKLSEFLVDFTISDGIENGAYIENIGWSHQGLIDTAVKHFGLIGKRFDFAKENPETAFERMIEELKNGPVIASIYKNLNPQNGGHLAVVFGTDEGNVLFADPDIDNPSFIERKATLEEFKNGWKKRYIVIRPE